MLKLAVHLVQTVEVEVTTTVEIVLVVITLVEEPELTVLVTGHSVVVVYVTIVTVESPGTVPEGEMGEVLTPGAGDVTGELPLGTAGLISVGVDPAGVDPLAAGVVSVTGHTVVEMAMVEVTTVVESAGQLVTVGAQLVIVISLVVYTVDVVQ